MDPITQQEALAAAGAGGSSVYVDDVFSTYLYKGNGTSQSIVNGIDLSGEGGLAWIRNRNASSGADHIFTDTERGTNTILESNRGRVAQSKTDMITSFNSNGFSIADNGHVNENNDDICSWTFRKSPGFFDVVTYTGNGSGSGQTISHNLGSAPGSIWIKRTSADEDWCVYHRSIGTAGHVRLNQTGTYTTNQKFANVTSTSFGLADDDVMTNGNGDSYVAYIFAHDDQSFGDDGDEAIIKCGSYTGNGTSGSSVNTINLGFEPQWLMIKKTSASGNWLMFDTMRGFTVVGSVDEYLYANNNSSGAVHQYGGPTATGFQVEGTDGDANGNGDSYIYIAIRRPHKPPEAGTDVFAIDTRTGSNPSFVSNFPVDMAFKRTVDSAYSTQLVARLTGGGFMYTNLTSAETSDPGFVWDYQNGWAEDGTANSNVYSWMFKRAPGFFDVVTYTGNGVQGRNISHNLGVAPELMIVKNRDTTNDYWATYVSGITYQSVHGNDPDNNGNNPPTLKLNDTFVANFSMGGTWDHTHPTATTFRVGDTGSSNGNGEDLIAYLFATLPGISKVGTYTGTGSDLNIDCGFTNGARFVLIKRVSGATDWWFVDTVRGINAGNDPALRFNDSAAETSSYDLVDPYSAGFTAVADTAAINSSGETYIYLAIA